MAVSNYLDRVVPHLPAQLKANPTALNATRLMQAAVISLVTLLLVRQAASYLAGRLIIYGCQHRDPKIVGLFSRFVTVGKAQEIATGFVRKGDSKDLEYFFQNGIGRFPSVRQQVSFERVVEAASEGNQIESFMKLFEANLVTPAALSLISSDFLRTLIAKKNLSLTCFLLGNLAFSPGVASSSLAEVALTEVTVLYPNFSATEQYKIIPVFFDLLQKNNYYNRTVSDQRKTIYEMFQKGLKFNVIDVNIPFDPLGNRYLHFIIHEEEAAIQYLNMGADPSLPNLGKETPLHIAAEKSSLRVINHMLGIGIEGTSAVDSKGLTPLGRSLERGSIEIALTFIRANERRKADFPYCTDEEFKKFIPLLVGHLQRTAVFEHERQLYTEMLFEGIALKLIDIDAPIDPDGNRFIHWAIEDPDLLEFFLERKANPNIVNSSNTTPLMMCMQRGNAEAVVLLCAHGAAVPPNHDLALQLLSLVSPLENTQNVTLCLLAIWRQINWLDIPEDKPLHVLVFSDSGFRLLESEGLFNRPLTADGLTLFHLAVVREDVDAARYIADRGVDVTTRLGQMQFTALHLARASNRATMIAFLLSNFPQLLNLRASDELTVFEGILHSHDNRELVPIFIEHCKAEDLLPALHKEMEQAVEPSRTSMMIPVHHPNGFVQELLHVLPLNPFEEVKRMQKYVVLRRQLVQLLKKSQLFQQSLKGIYLEFRKFKTHREISGNLICQLATHQPYLQYLGRIPYEELVGVLVRDLLRSTLESEEFQMCFMSLAEPYYRDAPVQLEEASQLKEACLALNGMCKMLKVVPTQSLPGKQGFLFHQMAFLIGSAIQKSASKSETQKRSFAKDYDEQDGMVLVGGIFAEIKEGKVITAYCQRALKMGLAEGRDFRAVGIDDNLAALHAQLKGERTEVERKALEQELIAEKKRKKTDLIAWKKRDCLKEISFPDDFLFDELCNWEIRYNRALLSLLFTKENQLVKLLHSAGVDVLSKLKQVNLQSLSAD